LGIEGKELDAHGKLGVGSSPPGHEMSALNQAKIFITLLHVSKYIFFSLEVYF